MADPTLPATSGGTDVVWQPLDWYAAPLYYDIIFEEETAREADWLHSLFTLFGPLLRPSDSHPTVLEPACGSGRLLHALLVRGYTCIGFDRESAAVEFARSKCEAALTTAAEVGGKVRRGGSVEEKSEYSSLSSAAPSSFPPPPSCSVFEAELSNFTSTHPQLLPPSSIHMAHCLVSSLKYLHSEQAVLSHFSSVCATLVSGGLYVVALHLSDYDSDYGSVDQHTAERDKVRVAMTITCSPPNRQRRSEQVSVRMVVTSTADTQQQQQQCYCWEESMRTYDRLEMWKLLAAVSERWFDVVATFDYEQARRGVVEETLDWPQPMQPFDANILTRTQEALPHTEIEWTGWDGVEALAVVLRRKCDVSDDAFIHRK